MTVSYVPVHTTLSDLRASAVEHANGMQTAALFHGKLSECITYRRTHIARHSYSNSDLSANVPRAPSRLWFLFVRFYGGRHVGRESPARCRHVQRRRVRFVQSCCVLCFKPQRKCLQPPWHGKSCAHIINRKIGSFGEQIFGPTHG